MNKLMSHAILFRHDAPEVAADMLFEVDHLSSFMNLHFIDRKKRWDLLQQEVRSANLLARAYVVHQWLSVLRYTAWKGGSPLPDLETL